ncbi:MAG: preprotein translocase subunit SecY [bacterium]|jgi:preprotein translocase subunit SecY
MSSIQQQIASAWNVPDLKKRLYYVVWGLLIFVVGTHIPAPGMDQAYVDRFFQTGGGGLFDLLDVFGGGALKRFSIFALGIMPYINASIMMQLLVAIYPQLKEIQQEGEMGQRIIGRYTRWLTVVLAFLQGTGLIMTIQQGSLLVGSGPFAQRLLHFIVLLASVVAGTMFLMFLGDEITKHGIGNGVSLIITIGIINRIPLMLAQEFISVSKDQDRIFNLVVFAIFCVIIVAGVVYVQLAVRKIPIHYARRQVGRKIYGGQSTYLPIRVLQAGVIPIIFATSILLIPSTISSFISNPTFQSLIAKFQQSFLYVAVEFVLIILFTFVYTAITFNTEDISNNLKKNGGFIPGIRPGKPTFEFLDKVLHRVTFFGAFALAIISVLPYLVNQITGITSFWLGGTSLLIVVGVALDTVQQLQAHLVMRHYTGFTKA